MAKHLWLVNGKTSLIGNRRNKNMARRKRRHHNRKHRHINKRRHMNARRHHRKHNPHRRHSRHMNRRRGWHLFNPGPDVVRAGESLAAALFAGAAGYVAAKGIGIAAEMYLPDSIPQKALVGTGLSSVAAAFLASKFLKGRPKMAAGVITGATIPLAEELIAMTPLGPAIGLIPAEASAPSALPAPGGVSAALAARLSATLRDSGDDDDEDNENWASY